MAQYIRLRDYILQTFRRKAFLLSPSEHAAERYQPVSLARRLGAETVGTALLLATVVGSGIMAERLSGGNTAIALLANTLATGAALVALILTFGPISGAHFNPAVTFTDAIEGGISWRETPTYILAQVAGAILGTISAHLMFQLPLLSLSRHIRSGRSQVFSEFVATFGLLSVIWGCSRLRSSAVAFAVGSYITAGYWFTASTSFANPAVTLARAHGHVFGYSPCRRALVHTRPARRRARRDVSVSLARAWLAKNSTGNCRSAWRR